MNKTLIAQKVKDGYLVKITTTIHVLSKEDVWKIIRYEGLRRNLFTKDKENLYAD
jgi:hypothetical protein